MANLLPSGQAVGVTESSHAVGPQHEIEVILFKQVASYLATPIFVVDPAGSLVYYNEPAERLLGSRYDETGEMPMSEWSTVFVPRDEHGVPLPGEALPLALALERHEPAHGDMWITGLDGAYRHISVTAFPLVGQHERDLGAVAIFWESDRR
jgi:PAS domain-containing protein